jgi:uncharacterized alkaline shock family protein YloU
MAGKTKIKPAGAQVQGASEAVIPGRGCGGVIRIAASGIISIVRQAACAVDGVTRITGSNLINNIAEFVGSRKVMDRAIQIEVKNSRVSVELSINVCYGVSLPEVAAEVQKNVTRQIEELTSLEVDQVNVIIREMEELPDDDNDDER